MAAALTLDEIQLIDVDAHITEPHDLWSSRAPAALKDRLPHVETHDGKRHWVVDGVEMASYRGDLVNSIEATPAARRPDPERLLRAHLHSAATLNYARALLDGGFDDLHQPRHWDLGRCSGDVKRRRICFYS